MRSQILTLTLALLATASIGCHLARRENKPLDSAAPLVSPPLEHPVDLLAKGQKLLIRFYKLPAGPPQFQVERSIQRDGTTTLLSNKVFVAADRTRRELEEELQAHYVSEGIAHQIRILVGGFDHYFVTGEVREPGMRVLAPPAPTLLEAIDSAGGFTAAADLKRLQVQHQSGDVELYNYRRLMGAATNIRISPGDTVKVRKKRFLW